MCISLWRQELEISSTSSKLQAEEALNSGLQMKTKEFQVRPVSTDIQFCLHLSWPPFMQSNSMFRLFWKVNQLITSHMKPLWKSINKHSVILFCHSFCYVLLLKQTTIIFHGIEALVISGIILPTVTAHVFYRIHWIEHFRKKKSQSVILTRYRLSGLLTGWDWFLKKWSTD